MELQEKLNKKSVHELYELKCIVESISNKYAEQLTDYALLTGQSSIDSIEKQETYQKRMKYKDLSLKIEEILINKIENLLLC